MKPGKSRASKQKSTIACIVQTDVDDRRSLLERTLETAQFWGLLETHSAASGEDPSNFQILLKPDLDLYEAGGTTGTDPLIVELFIEALYERGYNNVAVADGPNVADPWLENRDVLALADLVGYRFETPTGHPYDVIDLSEDLTAADFPDDTVLCRTHLSTRWLNANFRINIPKFKTDEDERFSLALNNLLGVLPPQNRVELDCSQLDPGDVATALLEKTPVHFTLIEAFRGNHGSQGTRASNPFESRTMIASSNLLLADWVGALKMGLDPYASSINARALHELGLPANYEIQGDINPFAGWKNVSLMLADSVRGRNRNPAIRRHAAPWIQTVDTSLFPFKSGIDSQANTYLAPLVKDIDDQPLARNAYLALNALLASFEKGIYAWRLSYDKSRLRRRQVPLGIDLESYNPNDYNAVADYITPLATIARQTPPDANGLRWRYIDGSVLFEYRRLLPIPYDRFVERVDICKAVELMYDNIGGVRVSVKKDRRKRTVHQAERNIYLPQPNWMVFFGGEEIDVGKIEVIDYGEERQQIFWRTVTSANRSAEFDDGLVAFIRRHDAIEIQIVARQKFALPLFWQAVNMDYFPEIKDRLVSDAYNTFFSRTIANYEATYEGRETRIGRLIDAKEDEEATPPGIEQFDEILAMLISFVQRWIKAPERGGTLHAGMLDEHGYRHVEGNSPAESASAGFWRDLTEAMKHDAQRMAGLPFDESSRRD